MLREKILKGLHQVPYLFRALSFVWHAAGRWTIAWLLLLILQGLLPVANVYLTRLLVNQLVNSTEVGLSWETIRAVLVPIILIAVVMMISALLNSLGNWIRTAQSERVQDYISELIHQKSLSVDLAFYDSPEFFDRLHRARNDAIYRPVALLESIGILIQNGITMFSMLILLLQFGWWMPVALLLSNTPIFYIVLQHRLRLYQWRLRTTPAERKVWYYEWLLTMREAAAELRLFDLGNHFQSLYKSLRIQLRDERTRLARDQAGGELLASVLSLLVTAAATAWMLVRTVAGLYSLGDLAFFYSAFNQGQGLGRSLLENVGEIYSNSLFLGDLFDYLALESQVVDPPEPLEMPTTLQQGIQFQDVTYSYPGSLRKALNGLSLTIPAGKIVAIVGPNGAGKSTLIRLLCRFYDPQTGSITIDGIDLRDLSLIGLRRGVTVLFQDPVQYFESARNNIAFGDLESNPSEQAIQNAALASGADVPISRLPEGMDSLLGKWFETGNDLSVGEWQRIALGRAFLRQAPIMILDEPTSAMDPWSEADWYSRFKEISKGKTALIITHRFTTAANADEIHVVQEGKIVESGSHRELLGMNGYYSQSWKAQMAPWLS